VLYACKIQQCNRCITFNVSYFVHRRENKDFLDAVLDDATKQKRRRQDLIGIQMTVISWSFEFISGILVLIDVSFAHSEKETWGSNTIATIGLFLYCIIIPGTYLLKTENLKNIIFKKGWSEPLREFFHLGANRVVPNENIQMNPIQNMLPAANPIPGAAPISVISGRSEASSRRS